VPRRVSLPGADELFRSTSAPGELAGREAGDTAELPDARPGGAGRQAEAEVVDRGLAAGGGMPPAGPGRPSRAAAPATRRPSGRPSGRERHEEKITVYCSAEELIQLESARLTLRGDHGLAVDRGRIVREALAVVLADLDAKGDSSILVRRLRTG
jgi:hypothetical protein